MKTLLLITLVVLLPGGLLLAPVLFRQRPELLAKIRDTLRIRTAPGGAIILAETRWANRRRPTWS